MILNYIYRYQSNFLLGEQETENLSKHNKFTLVFNLPYGSHNVVLETKSCKITN